MSLPTVQLVWFRRDLRVHDHAALTAAAAQGLPTLAIVIEDKASSGLRRSSSEGWWHRSLHHLQASLDALNIPLLYLPFSFEKAVAFLRQHVKINAVFFHRYEEPSFAIQDNKHVQHLTTLGISCHPFPANLLFSPGEIVKKDHTPYLIFTAFYKRCMELLEICPPLDVPKKFTQTKLPSALRGLNTLKPCEKVSWETHWRIGENNTRAQLKDFLAQKLKAYEHARNFPALPATSGMSAPLHFGEITPRSIFYEARHLPDTDCFFKEIIWREFAYHTLHFFPELSEKSLYEKMLHFPYRHDKLQLAAWQQGLTGYPIVDAGMRQLLKQGTIHNRVRMIVGSFLTKDLLLPWQEGAHWFLQHLVDADLASNSLNWQWVAGSGIDPQPFFRIFHPVLQGKKFDPEGTYVRQFVPELSMLPDKWIHSPWEAPESVLHQSNVVLGHTYPLPIVDHAFARKRALDAYRRKD